MSELLKDIPMYAGIAVGTYTAVLVGGQIVQDFASEKIESEEQLDQIIKEEAEKLGMDSRLIVGRFHKRGSEANNRIFGARCTIEDFEFEGHTLPMKTIDIKEGWGARRGAVRHELYHLHRHFPQERNPIAKFLKGFFYEEPTATLYAITGIKL